MLLVSNRNAEELAQWSAAAAQKEEDAAALAAYQRQDEARVRDLSMALERRGPLLAQHTTPGHALCEPFACRFVNYAAAWNQVVSPMTVSSTV